MPLISAWRWWLPPAIVSLILILIFVDPFIGDWDALEYTVSAVRGYPSSMALGRGLFIFYNHALYLAAHSLFNLSAQRAYLLFKYVVVAQGLLSVVACWTLARDLSGSLVAATIAALLVATSPMFVVYSGQVMTDVPALLLINIALIIHLRGLQQRRMLLVLIATSPLILITIPIALVNQWRERKWSPIFLLALVGLFADILLLLNYSTAINWRYLLSGLPALAPLGASFLTRSLTKRFASSRSALIACSAV